MKRVFGFEDQEVIDEIALLIQGLGTDSSFAGFEVIGSNFGDQFLETFCECRLAYRAIDLLDAFTEVPEGEFSESRKPEGFDGVLPGEVRLFVTFPRKGEHGVRTCVDASVNHLREMDSEEGEVGVGDRVDESFYEVSFLGTKLKVFSTKRDDAGFGIQT